VPISLAVRVGSGEFWEGPRLGDPGRPPEGGDAAPDGDGTVGAAVQAVRKTRGIVGATPLGTAAAPRERRSDAAWHAASGTSKSRPRGGRRQVARPGASGGHGDQTLTVVVELALGVGSGVDVGSGATPIHSSPSTTL